MGPRPLLVMALGWVAVVVAVAAITFVVVDRAGRGVGQASAAATVAPVTSAAAGGTTPSSGPEPVPGARPTIPGPTPTLRQAEPRTASFTTEGGTLVASCSGTQISVDSVRPRDGWRFEKDSEHGGLEVVFIGAEREVEIVVTCVRGVPNRSES